MRAIGAVAGYPAAAGRMGAAFVAFVDSGCRNPAGTCTFTTRPFTEVILTVCSESVTSAMLAVLAAKSGAANIATMKARTAVGNFMSSGKVVARSDADSVRAWLGWLSSTQITLSARLVLVAVDTGHYRNRGTSD